MSVANCGPRSAIAECRLNWLRATVVLGPTDGLRRAVLAARRPTARPAPIHSRPDRPHPPLKRQPVHGRVWRVARPLPWAGRPGLPETPFGKGRPLGLAMDLPVMILL